MLYHHCSSKFHLLSACPTASVGTKIHFLSKLERNDQCDDSTGGETEIFFANQWKDISTQESSDCIMSDGEFVKF
jgi:hypothetical protein